MNIFNGPQTNHNYKICFQCDKYYLKYSCPYCNEITLDYYSMLKEVYNYYGISYNKKIIIYLNSLYKEDIVFKIIKKLYNLCKKQIQNKELLKLLLPIICGALICL